MKHSLFWAAVEATSKAARTGCLTGFHAARAGFDAVGALVDCGIPRQHAGAQWLTEKEAEEDVAEPQEVLVGWAGCLTGQTGNLADCTCLTWSTATHQDSRTNAGATSSRAVEEGLTEETPPVSSVSAAINYRGEQLSWCEYVQPAILDVLANHVLDHDGEFFNCYGACAGDSCAPHVSCPDLMAWREHVAPLIAERLEKVTLALPEM